MTAMTTPLHALHLGLGGRMVDFAGYELPVNYPGGIIAEHTWTREHAGLFDVSHMGQAILAGEGASARLETLLPGDLQNLAARKIRYSQFTNAEGGILDDLMVTKLDEDGDVLFLVVNAACKRADFAHVTTHLPDLGLTVLEDRALLALQGPQAAQALERHVPGASALPFMTQQEFCWREQNLYISRSGYTGEDGFEISIAADFAEDFAETLLAEEEVKAVGLGAREFSAAGSGPVPLRPRHRHDHQPDRGRPELVDLQAAPRRGRLSRRRAHPARTRARPNPRKGRAAARGQGARARRR